MAADEEDLSDGKGGVFKKIIKPGGEQEQVPPAGSEVTVHYVGWLLNGHKFDSSRDREEPFTFKLGVGAVIEGWDLAVASMKPGEVSAFTVRADYGYGWEGKPPKIPIDATLRFEIELISWKPSTKPVDEMSPAEKREHGLSKRAEGTRLLKKGKFSAAASEFEAGVESLWTLHALMKSGAPNPAALAEVFEALRSCLLNHAQCSLKLGRYEDAAALCSRILALPGEEDNVKARYRRGVALAHLLQYVEAKEELRAACKLDPKSKEIRDEYERVVEAHAAQKRAEREAFGGMFEADMPVLDDNEAPTPNSRQEAEPANPFAGGKPFAV